MPDPACAFCKILAGEVGAHVVLEDEHCVAFLDERPVFPGHTLVVPRDHHETLTDLPPDLMPALFGGARVMAEAVEIGLGADGSFVALNNRVSQSVPHIHVHVIPRRFKDGLRGFFWPRRRYEDEAEAAELAAALRAAVLRLSRRARPSS